MRLALIDLGTNAVRFDVQEIQPDGRTRRLHRERLMVRLGEGVFQGGRLSRPAMGRTLAAFESFSRTCRDLRVDKVTAFGTSALREASNSEDLINLLRRRTGLFVRVISGAEEARLIAQGVLRHEKVPKGVFAIIDVGGGSVEIILCRNRRVVRSSSLDLGVARLQQSFLKSVPPPPDTLDALRRHVRGVLKAAAPRGGWPSVEKIIGSGGTVRALARIYQEAGDGGERFNAKDLERMTDRLAALSLPRLLKVPGMEPKRGEFILAGAALMAEVAEALEAGDLRPTDYALRDGMLAEELRLHGKNGGAASPGFDAGFLLEKARRLGAQPDHTRRVMALSSDLFDNLKGLHRLAPAWRDLLVAAAALHDTGEAVSPVHHERHSAYVALHADVPFMDPWEHEFVSLLCLWHKGGKVEEDGLPFRAEPARRNAFFKILSLLRVADALDRGHAGRVRVRSARVAGRRVFLSLSGVTDLELLRLEQKKELFEKVFGKSLEAR